MTWTTHLRQRELLRKARAQQAEFCRLQGHDYGARQWGETEALMCRRCGACTIPDRTAPVPLRLVQGGRA